MKKRNPLTLLGGVGLGAGLMYFLDPDDGRRRRALARDKAVHGLKVGGKALRKTSADVGNRRPSPRTAVLGLGGVGALAGLGLLARSKGSKPGDLKRPLRESRWGKAKPSGQQLEW
ncbi:MAG TPA: hypothetical protein VEG34_13765 [Thermoanaerobaculia bacterium]|nr:hypothetical protein [Thermoanaerobaculia bacterium]